MELRAPLATAALLLSGLSLLTGCPMDDPPRYDDVVDWEHSLVLETPPPSSAAAGETLEPITVVYDGPEGVEGVLVAVSVDLGGGATSPASATTDASGRATFEWTLGPAPITNRVRFVAGHAWVAVDATASCEEPWEPEPFGAVAEWLAAEGKSGGTEDLAFHPDRGLFIGVPGGLLGVAPDGTVQPLALSGEPLTSPLGVAVDQLGDIWVADAGRGALLRVAQGGEVSVALEVASPNYVAIGHDGHVWVSDHCNASLYRYDPTTETVVDVVNFDPVEQGGPNGLAFDESGETLWVATENAATLCGLTNVPVESLLAGVYRLAVSDDSVSAPEAVATELGHFGDGLAFDEEGNLYVVVDRLKGTLFSLEESAIWVLPAGGGAPRKFLTSDEAIFANVAFGEGDYGDTTLYISLLPVALLGRTAPGLMRFDVGVRGQRLLPEPLPWQPGL